MAVAGSPGWSEGVTTRSWRTGVKSVGQQKRANERVRGRRERRAERERSGTALSFPELPACKGQTIYRPDLRPASSPGHCLKAVERRELPVAATVVPPLPLASPLPITWTEMRLPSLLNCAQARARPVVDVEKRGEERRSNRKPAAVGRLARHGSPESL